MIIRVLYEWWKVPLLYEQCLYHIPTVRVINFLLGLWSWWCWLTVQWHLSFWSVLIVVSVNNKPQKLSKTGPHPIHPPPNSHYRLISRISQFPPLHLTLYNYSSQTPSPLRQVRKLRLLTRSYQTAPLAQSLTPTATLSTTCSVWAYSCVSGNKEHQPLNQLQSGAEINAYSHVALHMFIWCSDGVVSCVILHIAHM